MTTTPPDTTDPPASPVPPAPHGESWTPPDTARRPVVDDAGPPAEAPATVPETIPAVLAIEHVRRPVFTGEGAEYFRIWVVNLLLTLLTLGVYSAWAKVRKQRWFWQHTRLDGHVFDFW